MDYSSFATFICTGIIIIIFLILIVWTWFFKLKKDYKRYIQNYTQILDSSTQNPNPGDDGDDGKDAYDIYLEKNKKDDPPLTFEEFESKYKGENAYNNYINGNFQEDETPLTLEEFQTRYQVENGYDNYLEDNFIDYPPLTLSEFEAKYEGVNAAHGEDALPAINGEHGEDGSMGDIGIHGQHGEDGENGIKGETGLEGDSFITFYESSIATLVPPVTIPNGIEAPKHYPSCAFVSYDENEPEAYIKYFFKGKLLVTITTSWTKDLSKNSSGFISYIIYDENKNIIGFTEPLTLFNLDVGNKVTTKVVEETNNTQVESLYYRGILSLNKALTMSSFTYNIMESNLSDKEFLFRRAIEIDPFIDKFYNIIQDVPELRNDDVDFFDMSKISEMKSKNINPLIPLMEITLG